MIIEIKCPKDLDIKSYAMAKLDLDYLPSIDEIVNLLPRGIDKKQFDVTHPQNKLFAVLRYL